MTTAPNDVRKLHVHFLLLLAFLVSLLFFRMIQSFVVALLLAAIFAALVYPFHTRVIRWLGGRKTLAATVTVVLGLSIIVIPLLVFLALVAHGAVEVGDSAMAWVKAQQQDPGGLDRLIDKIPLGKRGQIYFACAK